jgi:hypothetical protein
MVEETIAERWRHLDQQRYMKLERSRKCASLTIPSLLPPEGWTEEDQLPQPYSSVPARGVTNMASRILSAMLPLNDTPFFRFELQSGMEPNQEVWNFLESLSYQVHNKLSSKNLRETIYTVLQHLIVVGDSLVIVEDSLNFRAIRLDQYVVRRDVEGTVEEIIYLEYISKGNDVGIADGYQTSFNTADKKGYEVHYVRLTKEEGIWIQVSEDADGVQQSSGEYEVSPFIPLRWSSVTGENYGRSHCEDIIGDIQTLESYTEALSEGIAAGSAFWIGVDPSGITELDDLASSENGSFVAARQQDVFTISPSGTMNPQIQATQIGVENMRREIGNAFLLSGSAIPSGDRVTATAVRMIGSELETILGGAFSSISRELMEPIVSRVVHIMLQNEEIDPRLAEQFAAEGILTVEIVTGLQALSRDSDLQKLMQMGEMVRNLPEPALALFRWEEYARALVTAVGFDSKNWVKSEEEAKKQQMELAQAQQEIATQGQMKQGMGQMVTDSMSQAAAQDMEATGGAGIQEAMASNPEMAQQIQQMMGGA